MTAALVHAMALVKVLTITGLKISDSACLLRIDDLIMNKLKGVVLLFIFPGGNASDN